MNKVLNPLGVTIPLSVSFVTTVLLYERLYTWFAIKVYLKAFESK